jgi:hypothetical protein
MPCFEVSSLRSLSSSISSTLVTLPHFNNEYATDPFNFLEPHRSHDSIPLQVLKGRNRKHGNTFYFTIGKTVRLSIADPQLIKAILIANSNSYAKPHHVQVLGILGTGIFASSGEVWAPQRQLLNGAFHTKEIKVCRIYMPIPSCSCVNCLLQIKTQLCTIFSYMDYNACSKLPLILGTAEHSYEV